MKELTAKERISLRANSIQKKKDEEKQVASLPTPPSKIDRVVTTERNTIQTRDSVGSLPAQSGHTASRLNALRENDGKVDLANRQDVLSVVPGKMLTAPVDEKAAAERLQKKQRDSVLNQMQGNAPWRGGQDPTQGAMKMESPAQVMERMKGTVDMKWDRASAEEVEKQLDAYRDQIAEMDPQRNPEEYRALAAKAQELASRLEAKRSGEYHTDRKSRIAELENAATQSKDFNAVVAAERESKDAAYLEQLLGYGRSKQQMDVALYYAATGQWDKVKEYKEAVQWDVNAARMVEHDASARAAAEKNPYLVGVPTAVAASFATPLAWLKNTVQLAKNNITGTYTPVDTNSAAFAGAHLASAATEGASKGAEWGVEVLGKDLGSFVVETGISIGQFLSKVPLGPLALGYMGAGAAGQTTYEALKNGASSGQAFALGTASGVIEAVTEKIGLDNLMDIVMGAGKAGVKSALKQVASEASEEVIAEIAGTIADIAVMGANSDFKQYVASLVAGGMTREQAETMAFKQFFVLNTLWAAAGGALSGGVMGIGGVTANAVRAQILDVRTGKFYAATSTQTDAIAAGLNFQEGSQSRPMAENIRNRILSGGTVRASDIGALIRTMNAEQAQYGPKNAEAKAAVQQTIQDATAEANGTKAARVITPAAQVYMNAGVDVKTADTVGEIAIRVRDADPDLKPGQLAMLDLSNPVMRTAFTDVTGIEVGNVTTKSEGRKEAIRLWEEQVKLEEKRVETAKQVAEEYLAVQQKAAEQAQALAQRAQEQAAAAEAEAVAKQQEAVPEETAPAEQAAPDAATMGQAEFIAAYQAANPGASEAAAASAYADAQMQAAIPALSREGTNPATETATNKTRRHSAGEVTPGRNVAEKAAKTPQESSARKATPVQELTVAYLNNVLSKRKGAPRVVLSHDLGGEYGNYDAETNTIYLNAELMNDGTAKYGQRVRTDQQALVYTCAHELIHAAKANGDAGIVGQLLAFAEKVTDKETVQEQVKQTRKRYVDFHTKLNVNEGMSPVAARLAAEDTCDEPGYIEEEVAADIMRDVFLGTGGLERMARYDSSLLMKLRRGVLNFLDAVAEKRGGKGLAAKIADSMHNELTDLVDRMDRALRSVKNGDTMAAENSERGVRSSVGEKADDGRRGVPGVFHGGADDLGHTGAGSRRGGEVLGQRGGAEASGEGAHPGAPGVRAKTGVSDEEHREWVRRNRVTPRRGSPEALAAAYAEQFGAEVEVINRDAMAERGSPIGFTRQGVIYLGDNLPAEYVVQAPSHELIHLMKQLSFSPYIAMLETFPDELLATDRVGEYIRFVMKHRKLSGEYRDLTDRQKIDVIDELLATAYGGYARDSERGVQAFEDVVEDPAWLFERIDDILEQFKSRNTQYDRRYSVPEEADTNTPEFKRWFHDDSGELTNEDGSPKVFLRGDLYMGSTEFRDAMDTNSKGLFFSRDMGVAKNYAHFADRSNTTPAKEFKPRVVDSWSEAEEFVRDSLGERVRLEKEGRNWVLRTGVEGEQQWSDLRVYPGTKAGLAEFNADYDADLKSWWELEDYASENFPEGHAAEYLPDGAHILELTDKWQEIGRYTDSPAGLAKFNATYGQAMVENEVENPGWGRYYLSAKKTLVFDAEGRKWNNVDGGGTWTNDIAAQAWDDGYDLVVIKNVQDGSPELVGEFDENDNFTPTSQKPIDIYIAKKPTQVKSVYNTGEFNPRKKDVRYSAPALSDADAPGTRHFSWSDQIDMLNKGALDQFLRPSPTRDSTLYVAREATALLQDAGLSDLPFVMTKKHARDIMTPRYDKAGKVINGDAHDLTNAQMKRLPEMIASPVAVYAADPNRHYGGVWILTDEVDSQGYPIFISIKPDQPSYAYDSLDGPAHFVNIFARQNYHTLLENVYRNGQTIYQNKEKVNALAPPVRADILQHSQKYGVDFDAIIRQKDPTVKPRYSADEADGVAENVNPDTGYARGSIADAIMQVMNAGDREGATALLREAADLVEQLEVEYRAAERDKKLKEALSPKLTRETVEQNKRDIDELIRRYGRMEQTSAAQQEVNLPRKIDRNTKVRGFAQTAMAAEITNEVVANELTQDILRGDAGLTYVPVGDKATMEKVRADLDKHGFEKLLHDWEAIVESDASVTKENIAMAEQLYVEACANKDVATAQKLVAQIAVMGTRAGQSVQAMTLLKRMTPSGQLYYLQKAVNRLNKEQKGRRKVELTIDPALARKLLDAKTREEIDAAMDALIQHLADQLPVTVMDKWNAWRYLAMLGNPRTHVRNILGNVIFTPARLVKDVLAAGMEQALPQEQRTKSLAASKELHDFAKQDADAMREELTGGGKYNPADLIRDRRKVFKSKPLAWAEKFNSDAMTAEDWWFLKAAYARSLAGFLSARGADASALSGADSTPEGRRLLQEGRAYALKEAQKATYRDASKVAQTISQLKRSTGTVGSIFLDGVLPFTKTPINIVKRGVEYSPAGLLKGVGDMLTKVRRGEMTAAEGIDEICAGLTGTAVVVLGAFLASLGLLSGGQGDEDEDEFAALQGVQEYSLTVGDTNYTIDWMAPVALPLFVGAEIYSTLAGEREDMDADQALTAVVDGLATMVEPMLSLSMLDGLNQTLSANQYDSQDKALYNVAKTIVSSYFSQGVPTLLGQIARTLDDSRRTSFTPKGQGEVESWLSRTFQSSVLAKIPVAAEGRMLYLDAWGRADTESSMAMRALENFISPGYINTVKTTDVDAELMRLAGETKNTGVFPDKAQKYFTVDKETYAMTQEEYQAHLIERGQHSYELVSNIVHDPAYAGLDDATRAQAVELAYDYAASLAKVHTNAAYKPDKWMTELAALEDGGGDAAEYLLLRAQAKVSGESLTEVVLSNDDLAADVAAEYLFMETTLQKTIDEPGTSGYSFVLTDEQAEHYTELYREAFSAQFSSLCKSSKYRSGDLGDRKDMLSELKSGVGKSVREEMVAWLKKQGAKATKD